MTEQQGLRERKKARTRASIREHALRLFREQGYAATTVEQIAAAAEVSPSTFFRYFPTKEDVVLQDDMDERLYEAFLRQPPGFAPLAAMRAAIGEAVASYSPPEWELIREATALSMSVPEVRARMLDETARMIGQMTLAIARRAGLPPSDLRVRTFAGAILGIMLTVALPHENLAKGEVGPDMFGELDRALALLEEGLPLGA
jgi:AcrR family transcriptional regulator